MELVVLDGSVDLGGADDITKKRRLGSRLAWACLTCLPCVGILRCFVIVRSMRWSKNVVCGKFCPYFFDLKIMWLKTIAVDIYRCL